MNPRGSSIDCREAFDLLYAYLDGELSAGQEAEVRQHLEICKPCFKLATFESAYLRFLEARTRAQRAPAHLKKAILRQLLFSGNSSEQE